MSGQEWEFSLLKKKKRQLPPCTGIAAGPFCVRIEERVLSWKEIAAGSRIVRTVGVSYPPYDYPTNQNFVDECLHEVDR